MQPLDADPGHVGRGHPGRRRHAGEPGHPDGALRARPHEHGRRARAWPGRSTAPPTPRASSPAPSDLARVRRWADEHPSAEQVVQTDRLGLDVPSLERPGRHRQRRAGAADRRRPGRAVPAARGGADRRLGRQPPPQGACRSTPTASPGCHRGARSSSGARPCGCRSAAWEDGRARGGPGLTAHLVQLLYSRHRRARHGRRDAPAQPPARDAAGPPGWSFAADTGRPRPGSAATGTTPCRSAVGPLPARVGDVAGTG